MLPHLEFAGQSLNPFMAKDNEVLERVQQRAVGMMSGLQSVDYKERLKKLDMQAQGRYATSVVFFNSKNCCRLALFIVGT